ncbi:hypothetical protein COZ22_03180, partial [bacterium (Candidatus Howlettbacteria) CG_4_10_14_3_um_filter_37_10]
MAIKNINNQKGFTLIEMIVALSIFSILAIFVLDFYIKSSKNYIGSMSTREAQQNIRSTMEMITRYAKLSRTANWDGSTLSLNVRDENNINNYTVSFTRILGRVNPGDNKQYDVIQMTTGGNSRPFTSILTSQNLNISTFNVEFSPGVPTIITITLGGRTEESDDATATTR